MVILEIQVHGSLKVERSLSLEPVILFTYRAGCFVDIDIDMDIYGYMYLYIHEDSYSCVEIHELLAGGLLNG